jgi:hypothetical protein
MNARDIFCCHHPRPVYAGGFAGVQCQSAEALAKAGKRMIQYAAAFALDSRSPRVLDRPVKPGDDSFGMGDQQ